MQVRHLKQVDRRAHIELATLQLAMSLIQIFEREQYLSVEDVPDLNYSTYRVPRMAPLGQNKLIAVLFGI